MSQKQTKINIFFSFNSIKAKIGSIPKLVKNQIKKLKKMKKYKYYATWGKGRKPKVQADAEMILRNLSTYASLSKMWRVSSEYRADQARILIKNNDSRAELMFDRRNPIKRKISLSLAEICEKYTSMYYFVRIYDGLTCYVYDKYSKKLRRKVGPALNSIEQFPLWTLENPFVRVYTRGRTSNEGIVQLGKLVFEQKINKDEM